MKLKEVFIRANDISDRLKESNKNLGSNNNCDLYKENALKIDKLRDAKLDCIWSILAQSLNK